MMELNRPALAAWVSSAFVAFAVAACGGESGGSGQTADSGGMDVEGDLGDGGGLPSDIGGFKDTGPSGDADAGTADGGGLDGSSDGTAGDAGDAGPTVGGFGYPCTENAECIDPYCVNSELGKVCSQLCIEDCPAGWDCVLFAGSGVDAVFICVSRYAYLCQPCSKSSECNDGGSTQNACVDFDGNGSFCGASCAADGKCPAGYTCEDVELATGATVQQCMPDTGECTCSDSAIAQSLSTACVVENEHGSCAGERVCGPNGLTECSALVPEPEACNGVDDNCDGIVDPIGALGCTNYWEDNDDDGWGLGSPVCACSPPSSKSVTQGDDCNDLSPQQKPGALEYCNGLDDNCDNTIDEQGAEGCVEYFVDADDDDFGDPNATICLCKPNANVTLDDEDCNDGDPGVNPDAIESCNGIDDDCDGQTDELNADGCQPYFFDNDGDTYGVDGQFQCLCAPSPPFSATSVGDCDDAKETVKPFEIELCDGIDNNCDGNTDDAPPVEMCGQISQGLPACVNGQCTVGGCEPGWFDIDGLALSGCECKSNSVETSGPVCGSAYNLGTLSDNGATTTVQGIVVYDDESDWYRFSAPDGPDPAQGAYFCDTYHVRVRFLYNPENTYTFDVFRGSCASANEICVGSDDFAWRTDFYENLKGECPCHPTLSATASGVQECTDNSAGYWVRVYRAPGKPPICQSYNLELTNGVY